VQTIVWDYEPGSFRPLSQTERAPLREAPQDWIDQRFYAIVTDLVGTPTELVDPEGNIAWQPRSTLWGSELTASVGSAHCPLRFPGQYHDSESGLNYNHHRYYDPQTARFASGDPLGLSPDPNPYAYVSNPLRWVDPLGLAASEGCGPDGETFYRAMSKREFNQLGTNGEITVKGTENFVTQSRGYLEGLRSRVASRGGPNADKYSVLVRYEMAPGTRDALIAAGKSPEDIGQDLNAVQLKMERGAETFGLRPGSVDVFNSMINDFESVGDW
jgi:RHS repeat-associated protein